MTTIDCHPSLSRKIVDLPMLLTHRAAARAGGKTVVHCHGCFDIVHPGHIRYFQFAKQQGDILVVSLTGDPHVGKGEGRPYIPQELRAENLAALELVDFVHINPVPTAVELLETMKPDIYIKGREYEHNQHPGFLKEKHAVEAYGGRVIFSSGDVIYSSTHLIEKRISKDGRRNVEDEKRRLFRERYDIDRSLLAAMMDRVGTQPFVVMGDTILEQYQHCDATDLASDGPNVALTPLHQEKFLSGAAAVAMQLAMLGAKPTLLTSLGTDDASDAAIDELDVAGVNVLPIRNRKKIATRTRFLADGQKLFTLEECPSTPSDSVNERYFLQQVAKALAEQPTSTIAFFDAGLGLFTDTLSGVLRETIRESTAAAPHKARLCAMAVGHRGRLIRFKQADIAIASERGVRMMMGDQDQSLSALTTNLLRDVQTPALLSPVGNDGLFIFDKRKQSDADAWEGALRSEFVKSGTGRGQAMVAVDKLGMDESLLALTAALTSVGATVHQAAYAGLIAGVAASQQPGMRALTSSELLDFVE